MTLYFVLKFLHIMGATVLLGTGAGIAFFGLMAHRTGDPAVIAGFARLRSYAAAVQPLPVLAAAAALWRDEAHVEANRALYRRKFDLAEERLGERLGFYRPDGGFFLWLTVPDGETHALMGPNGAGKSTLAYALMGRDGYDVTKGTVELNGHQLLDVSPEERAASGLLRRGKT